MERVNNVNKSPPHSQHLKSASICQCIQSKLLHSLFILGRIERATSADESTGDKVNNLFDGSRQRQTKYISGRVSDPIDSGTYKIQPKDLAGGPESFVLHIMSALDERNASKKIQRQGTIERADQ